MLTNIYHECININMKTKVFVGLSTLLFVCVILSPSISPVFAQTTVTVSENGSGSNNSINYSQTSSTSVNQSNSGIISNILRIFSNTGDNSSSNNTGADTSTQTGSTTNTVNINNNLNSNYAHVDDCCAEVPEFGMIPGLAALLTSGGAFLYMKKKTLIK